MPSVASTTAPISSPITFHNSWLANLKCFGSASVTSETDGTTILNLTGMQQHCTGAAYLDEKMNGLIITFAFRMVVSQNSGADGLAFVLRDDRSDAIGAGKLDGL
ncbi:hypothetical protein BC938DRAFT_471328 [Jimgerdemannia flammicorona]|uniref:Uncharacterized protein n=1 Tax=Jimgerdemannia flammicorona TaxID=994334 RepID=A0A433Q8B5_9FUNG|nr:hypothetical protein BC938DRAFT_471328 [Jimgerdemannia flammicorona]